MKFYHTLPRKYFDAQTATGEFVPCDGSIWLADNCGASMNAANGGEELDEVMWLIEIDLDISEVEDHTDNLDICAVNGERYYIKRGNIPLDKIDEWGAV